LAWTQKAGEYEFVTAGVKHIKFWKPLEKEVKKGIFGGKGDPTSFPCAAYDSEGNAYTGGCNGKIYKWNNRMLQGTFDVEKGSLHGLRIIDGKILVGGKDGSVHTLGMDGSESECKAFGSLVRSVDCHNGKLLVGTRNGTISCDGKEIMHSHNDGEVWGLNVTDTTATTTGDDN
jgi:hypothetical protein